MISQVTLSDETLILVARAKQLLESETLSDENRQKLEILLSGIDDAQAIGDEEDLDELEQSLLDILFDLEN
jgi:hypothetical protein